MAQLLTLGFGTLVRRRRSLRAVVRAAAVLLGVTCFGAGDAAWASCEGPTPALLWSYPANGATNVPTNADLFFTGELFGLPTLDGVPLERLAGNAYELGQLAPQTTYEIRWELAVIAFTTGDEPAPETRPDLLSNDVLLRRDRSYDSCPLVPAQGCFDTGPPTAVEWNPGPARVWWVEKLRCDGSTSTMVWPSECGPPVLQDEDRFLCARLRGSNGTGLSEATDLVCSVPNAPLATVPRSSGCRGAWPADGATIVAGDDGITVGIISGSEEKQEPITGCSVAHPRTLGSVSVLSWVWLVGLCAVRGRWGLAHRHAR